MTSVSIADCGLGPDGAKIVAEYVRVSGSLTSLNLRKNDIGPKGGVAISEALKVNGSLAECNLRGNRLDEDGWCAIMDALRKNRDNKIAKCGLSNQGINPTIVKSLEDEPRPNHWRETLASLNVKGFLLPVKKLKDTDPVAAAAGEGTRHDDGRAA